MLAGELMSGIPQWRTEVTVNGIARAVADVSWDGELTGDIPEDVGGAAGLPSASGTIVWAEQEAVVSRPVLPWHKAAGWPPSPGDVVRLRVGDGATWWTRWTGVIDETTGNVGSSYQSKIIDAKDQITGTFSHEAILRHGVPFQEGGSYRSVGLNFWYPLTRVLRRCGFYNTPPVEALIEASAPMQGSVWPEAGTLGDAGGLDGNSHATFNRAQWGYAAGGFEAAYVPRLGDNPDTPVQITMMLGEFHSGVAFVEARFEDVRIRLQASAARGVTARHIVGTADTQVVSLSASALASATIVTLLYKDGQWTVRADNGASATASRAVTAGTMTRVYVSAREAARIAGVQVSRPNSTVREFVSLDFVPNLRFEPSGLASTMDMMRSLKGRSATDLVREILAATMTAAWWDENGGLVLVPSDRLRGQDSVATIETGDIASLSWSDALQSAARSVEVTWKEPAIVKGRYWRKELWRGTDETSEENESDTLFVEPPNVSEEWFGVDRTLRVLNDTGGWGAYNTRRGSFAGVWFSDVDGNEVTASGAVVAITSEPLRTDSMKITTKVTGLPSGVEPNSGTSPSSTALRPNLRGQALPVIRGMGRGNWVDQTKAEAAGKAAAAVLEHDLGYWGQRYATGETVADRIAAHLARIVTAPEPMINDLGLEFDPRRQVGDVVDLESGMLGIRMRALVVKLSETLGSGGAEQTARVRVLSMTSTRPVTYAELEAAWATSNYSGLEAVWSALTYADFEAAPLEGAPV